MGSISTKFCCKNRVAKYAPTPLELAIEAQFPVYYIRDVEITAGDIEITKTSWELIMSGEETKPYLEAKKQPNC